MKQIVIRIIFFFCFILFVLLICFAIKIGTDSSEVGKDINETNKIETTIDQSINIDLLNLLPKSESCNNAISPFIYKTIASYSENDVYDNGDCLRYNVFRIYKRSYNVDSVIYIEEYILLYDKLNNMYGVYLDSNFNLTADTIANNGKIDSDSILNFGQVYKHTFKKNDKGYYWFSTIAIKE